jgi:hypothetical protein
MSHVLFSEFADQKITALKKEADAARLARSARASKRGRARRHRVYRPAVISALLQR